MKLALAVLVFVLFGLAIGGGILLLIAGKPLLFILALLAFSAPSPTRLRLAITPYTSRRIHCPVGGGGTGNF